MVDATGSRIATWSYTVDGWVQSYVGAGNTGATRLTYGTDGTTTVTDALGWTYIGAGPVIGASVNISGGGTVLVTGQGASGVVVQASGGYGNGVVGVTASSAVGTNGSTTTISPGLGTIGASAGFTAGWRP